MKQKKQLEVPDSIFEALGFTLPKNVPLEYQKGDSITDFVGSSRIMSLKRENNYQRVYPSMSGISLLNLNYRNMPKEDYKQADYVLQIISRYIKDTLISFHKDGAVQADAETDALAFMQGVLGSYKDAFQISNVDRSSESAAEIACITFRLPSCYRIRLNFMDGETIYGAVGMKRKRRDGYYHLRGGGYNTTHIIDLVGLLARVFLFSGIHQINASVKLPLVQNVLKNTWIKKSGQKRNGICWLKAYTRKLPSH